MSQQNQTLRPSIVELAMERASRQQPGPDIPQSDAAAVERFPGRRFAPRHVPYPVRRATSHAASAVAGATLMWFVMDQPASAPSPTHSAASAPGIAAPPVPLATVVPSIDAMATNAPVLDMLERWRQSWSNRAVDSYLGFYSANFVPADGTTRSAWAEGRRKNLLSRSVISVRLHDIAVIPIDGRQVKVTLLQDYDSGGYKETRQPKTFVLALEGNDWQIAGEWQGLRQSLPGIQQ